MLWQVTLVDDRELDAHYTALSLFVRPDDPDGFDDLAELYLIDDQEELFWRLDPDTWQKSGSGDSWIGSNGLVLPDGAPLPAGEYRLLLRDLAGNPPNSHCSFRPSASRSWSACCRGWRCARGRSGSRAGARPGSSGSTTPRAAT